MAVSLRMDAHQLVDLASLAKFTWRGRTHAVAVAARPAGQAVGRALLHGLASTIPDSIWRSELIGLTGSVASQVMRTITGFHHDCAGMESGEEFDQPIAAELFAQQRLVLALLVMHVKAVLAKVDADEPDVAHDLCPN